jgi:hypothetical protein
MATFANTGGGAAVGNPRITNAARAAGATQVGGRGTMPNDPRLLTNSTGGVNSTTGAPLKASAAPKPSVTTSGTGLIAALNLYQQQQATKYKDQGYVADIYEIKFVDPIIASASVVPPGPVDKGQAGNNPGKTAADKTLPEKQSVATTVRLQAAFAGQQIVQFIDQVIRNSNYITDQSAVFWNEKTQTWDDNGKAAQQFSWFNIVVNAEQLDYDKFRNDFAYRMTFIITPYQIPVQSEYFEPGEFRGVHKVYNYWFTGQNTQVLGYEQNFNKLWSQAITGTGTGIKQQVNSREQWKKHVFQNSNQSSQGAENQKVFEPGANAADYLYTTDLASVKLSVIGDPAWIQNPDTNTITESTFSTAPFLSDGTVNINASGAYFEIAFNRPTDYDMQTGLMDPGKNNAFANREKGAAGVTQDAVSYVLTKVTSTFKGGRFSQDLEGSWLQNNYKKSADRGREVKKTATGNDEQVRLGMMADAARRSGNSSKSEVVVKQDRENIQQPNVSPLAGGIQQQLRPVTQAIDPTLAQLQSSPAYILARRSGKPADEALRLARQSFAAGTNNYSNSALPGIRTTGPDIVKDGNPG